MLTKADWILKGADEEDEGTKVYLKVEQYYIRKINHTGYTFAILSCVYLPA